ncbi:MAG: hypothetical protein HY725_12005 [Candidatus Rokubacteria bacterium]|nr:hypothetical protein [Candidatus Rokubacteria bacterium]
MKATRLVAVLGMIAVIAAWPGVLQAEGQKLVKVAVEFRQSAVRGREAVQGSGSVVMTEKGSVRPRGSVGADSRQTRVQQSTGIFTIVRDGGESRLTVATQVPYPQVAFFRDYATGAGYVATGVAFKEVGTSLKVSASILPGKQVRVRLTPVISHFRADGSGTIEFTEAATELVVESGRPVVLGGATARMHEVTREILGFRQSQAGSETTVVLIATVL